MSSAAADAFKCFPCDLAGIDFRLLGADRKLDTVLSLAVNDRNLNLNK